MRGWLRARRHPDSATPGPGSTREPGWRDSEDDLETMPRASPLNPAASRQSLREFRYEDAVGPRDVLRALPRACWTVAATWYSTRRSRLGNAGGAIPGCPPRRSSELGHWGVSLGSESLAKISLLLFQPTYEKWPKALLQIQLQSWGGPGTFDFFELALCQL